LNKIVSIKKTNAIFLAIVLVAGTIAMSLPSFMASAQAQQDYGIENNYDKKSNGKDVSVKSIKCNNVNVNVNGLELNVLPPSLANLLQGDKGERGSGSYENDGEIYEGGPSGSEGDFKLICINNNNNTVVEEEEPLVPTTATLKVTKQINCEDQIEGDCDDLLELVNENDYIFQVEGNNPDPSSPFPGSSTGTDVTLGPGDYVVSETVGETLDEDIQTFSDNHPGRIIASFSPSFTGDCTGTGFFEATGTIAAGESQTCNVINAFSIISITPLP
jgi:hypothetical protein